jgi:putative transposase
VRRGCLDEPGAILAVGRSIPGQCSARVSSRPAAHHARAGRTRQRAAQGPGRRAHPGVQKKPGGAPGEPRSLCQGGRPQHRAAIWDLKSEHPFWEYRRNWACLRYVDGLVVNQKRVYSVMKGTDLPVRPNPRLRHQGAATDPAQRVVGHRHDQGHDRRLRLGLPRGRARLAQQERWSAITPGCRPAPGTGWLPLDRAVNHQFLHAIEGQSLNLMADNGCRPTSLAFMGACAALGIRQAFTSYSNPKGNAELVLLHGWASPAAFFAALDRWLGEYNASYLHLALGYRAPSLVEAEHLGHATPLAAAC